MQRHLYGRCRNLVVGKVQGGCRGNGAIYFRGCSNGAASGQCALVEHSQCTVVSGGTVLLACLGGLCVVVDGKGSFQQTYAGIDVVVVAGDAKRSCTLFNQSYLVAVRSQNLSRQFAVGISSAKDEV